MNNAFFPIYIDLSQKEILVAGAGKIASRRIQVLSEFGGHLTVVAPEQEKTVQKMAQAGRITLLSRKFSMKDVLGKNMVFAATDDPDLNASIAAVCRERRILVNVCSDQSLCDFQFPSVVQKGEVVVGINASGQNHRAVKETRQKIEAVLQISGTESKYKENECAGMQLLPDNR